MSAPREPGLRQLLEAYRLAESLGGGADGQVLRGVARRGPDQGVSHAIKKFKKEAYDPSREIEVLERIQAHPNVLRLLGVYEHGSAKAFSTPLMDMDLATFKMRRRAGLAATQAMSFCQQLLCGLQHIHALRVVHRDVKPENILLRVDADGLRGVSQPNAHLTHTYRTPN